MFKKIKIDIPSLIVAVITNVFIVSVIFVFAAWTPPPAAPPTCPVGSPGCDAPLNVGPGTQLKLGALAIEGLLQTNSIDFNSQKICRAVDPGNWTDTSLVPFSWANVDCLRHAQYLISSDYTLGCLFRDGTYSDGEYGHTGVGIIRPVLAAGTPSPNCGWAGIVVGGEPEPKPATGTIVVHKVVKNLDGGPIPNASYFAPYYLVGVKGIIGVTLDVAKIVDVGTYWVNEQTKESYEATYSAGDCVPGGGGRVDVTKGSVKSCTITNKEIFSP